MGFEPTTASLEGWNSTTELRPPTANLPTRQHFAAKAVHSGLESPCIGHHIFNPRGPSRIEPTEFGGQARIRTLEAIRQQIYSLPPLSTWVPARERPISKRQRAKKSSP